MTDGSADAQSPALHPLPAIDNVRTYYYASALVIYRFRDGAFSIEQRSPAMLGPEDSHVNNPNSMLALMEHHSPCVQAGMVFDFPKPLKTFFIRQANICSSGTIQDLEAIDQEAQSAVGVTILDNPLTRECLMCISMAYENLPLVKALCPRGGGGPPPPPDGAPNEVELRILRQWRASMAGGTPMEFSTVTCLIRYGWLELERLYAKELKGTEDVELGKDRIDALIERNYNFTPSEGLARAKYVGILSGMVPTTPLPIIRYLLQRVPIPRGTPIVYDRLLALATRRKEDGIAAIDLLLQQGLDVNVVREEYRWSEPDATIGSGLPSAPALHHAIEADHLDVVDHLLKLGAEMRCDELGRTPREYAKQKGRDDAVKVLEAHLAKKGLPLDHVDEELAPSNA